MMNLSKAHLAILALIFANMIWGAAPPIFKWALHDIHPYTLATLRFVVPAIILLPFVKNKLKIHPKDYLNIILIGFFGITINIIFFFQGLLQAPSINAALIGSSAPVFIILYSLLFLKGDKPKKKLIIGTHLGLFGVILVIITPLFKHGNLASLGNLYYLIGMFGGVIAIILSRKVLKRNNPLTVTFWSFVIGSIGFIPFFLKEISSYGFLPNLTYQGVIGLSFGIFLSSLTAYFLQTWALKFLTAGDVSVFTYIDPVIAILIAAPLLGEYPDTTFVAGTFFVLLGILIAEGRLHYHPFHLFLKK